MKSQSLRVLLALTLGLATGMALTWGSADALARIVPIADVLGTLWTNAIRMTVIPLVATLTVASVASTGGTGELKQAGTRAVLVFVTCLVAGGLLALVVAQFAFVDFTMPADVIARLQVSVGAGEGTPALPSLAQRLIEVDHLCRASRIRQREHRPLCEVVFFRLSPCFRVQRQRPALSSRVSDRVLRREDSTGTFTGHQ